jgi:inosine-uridine nucleoside N-ribohydrolase
VAIALAALHPECALQAVSIVGGGNTLVADGVETATEMLQLCGRDEVPVFPGMGRGSDENAVERSKVFGQLADVVLSNEGRCVVVATGPLTNVAVLLRAFPDLVGSIREIVVLGGAFTTTGNAGPLQEANVCADPEAASAVLRSGARIKIVPLEVSQQLAIGQVDAERLEAPGTGLLQQRLAAMVAPLLAYYRVVFARDGCPIHDPLAVALALRPDLFHLRRAAVSVELTGDVTRGMTVRDDRPEAEGDNLASLIEVADRVDVDGILTLLDGVIPTATSPVYTPGNAPSRGV